MQFTCFYMSLIPQLYYIWTNYCRYFLKFVTGKKETEDASIVKRGAVMTVMEAETIATYTVKVYDGMGIIWWNRIEKYYMRAWTIRYRQTRVGLQLFLLIIIGEIVPDVGGSFLRSENFRTDGGERRYCAGWRLLGIVTGVVRTRLREKDQ